MKVAPLATSIASAALATVALILFMNARGDLLECEGKLAKSEADNTALSAQARKDHEARLAAQAALDKALAAHASTRVLLEASLSKETDLSAKLALAQTSLGVRDANERTLNREVAALNERLAEARTKLADMDSLKAHLSELEQALSLALNPTAPDGKAVVPTTQAPRRILALGPEDSFVIINYGTRDRAANGQRVIIRRGTDLIGTALISNALVDVSIAQVDPHSLREALHADDSIILAP